MSNKTTLDTSCSNLSQRQRSVRKRRLKGSTFLSTKHLNKGWIKGQLVEVSSKPFMTLQKGSTNWDFSVRSSFSGSKFRWTRNLSSISESRLPRKWIAYIDNTSKYAGLPQLQLTSSKGIAGNNSGCFTINFGSTWPVLLIFTTTCCNLASVKSSGEQHKSLFQKTILSLSKEPTVITKKAK